jgi:hypothetical protein
MIVGSSLSPHLIGVPTLLAGIALAVVGASASPAEESSPVKNEGARGRRAAAWYRISTTPLPLIEEQTANRFELEQFSRTQKAMINSPLVLSAALAQQGVASLPALRNASDKLVWLDEHVQVTFPEDGDVMEIAVADAKASEEDLLGLANAVSKAYYDEVVFRDQSERALPLQILRSSSRRLAESLHSKAEILDQLKRDQGLDTAGVAKRRMATDEAWLIRQRIEQLQSQHFNAKLNLRLADSQTADDSAADESAAKAAELKEATIDELFSKEEKRLKTRLDEALSAAAPPSDSVDLELRSQEIELLTETAKTIDSKVQSLQIEMQKPSRVTPISTRGAEWASATFYGH